jgi:hypothetical protein
MDAPALETHSGLALAVVDDDAAGSLGESVFDQIGGQPDLTFRSGTGASASEQFQALTMVHADAGLFQDLKDAEEKGLLLVLDKDLEPGRDQGRGAQFHALSLLGRDCASSARILQLWSKVKH